MLNAPKFEFFNNVEWFEFIANHPNIWCCTRTHCTHWTIVPSITFHPTFRAFDITLSHVLSHYHEIRKILLLPYLYQPNKERYLSELCTVALILFFKSIRVIQGRNKICFTTTENEKLNNLRTIIMKQINKDIAVTVAYPLKNFQVSLPT